MAAASDDQGDLRTQIRELHLELRDQMASRWDRDLPANELLSDRWDRAARLGFGQGASIYDSSYVFGEVSVGDETWIGPLVTLDGSGGLEIGHHCSISTGVQIYSHDTVRWALSAGKMDAERAPVRIGDCSHLGAQAVVLKGVTIGDHCVVGAGAVVTDDLPAYSIALGVPASVRGTVVVNQDEIELRLDD